MRRLRALHGGVLVLPKFWQFCSELKKNWSSGATEFGAWIGNGTVNVWKSTKHKLHKIWHSQGCARYAKILLSAKYCFCSVDFHTFGVFIPLNLQLSIQISLSVVPESKFLQVQMKNGKISWNRAHPTTENPLTIQFHLKFIFDKDDRIVLEQNIFRKEATSSCSISSRHV